MKKIIIITLSLIVASGVLFYFKFYKNCCEGGSCVHENTITNEPKAAAAINENDSLLSTITCPECGYKKSEPMPTAVCQLKYTCEKCGAEMTPKEGDCCVFCSHGDKTCPSKHD